MINKINKSSKTAVFFLISYIIVMLVPLLISVMYFYPQMRATLIEKAVERNMNAVKQVNQLMDLQLISILGMPSYISSNNNIIHYEILNSQSAARNAQTHLNQMLKTNSFIEHVFLYMRKNGYLISARTGSLYYDDLQINPSLYQISFGDISTTELQNILESTHETAILTSKSVTIAGIRHNEMIFFIMPVPQNKFAYGSVLICVPTSNLLYLIPKDTYTPSSSFLFVDREGKIIYSTGSLNDDDKSIIANTSAGSKDIDGDKYVDISGEQYLISWSKSETYGWHYINAVPLNSITQSTNDLQRTTIYIFLGVTLLSIFIIFIAMRINYMPIRKLALIAYNNNHDDTQVKNDFQAIQQLIDGLQTTNTQLGERINQTEPKLKEYLFSLMIQGQKAKLPDIIRQSEQVGMDLAKGPYCVLIANYENEQDSRNTLAKLHAHEPMGELSITAERDNKPEKIVIILSGIMDLADENALISVLSDNCQVAYGSTVDDISRISDSYNHAISALDYLILNGIHQRIRYDQLPERMFKPRNYPIEVMQSLETAIQHENSEQTAKLVHQIISILGMDGNAPYFTRSVYFIAANLLTTGLSRKIGDENAIVQEIGTRLMLSHYTLSEMINIIETTASHLCQIMDKYQNRAELTHILEYIERHINSYDLSLQSTADEFDMSASTFSKMFKEKSGLNFKEYVDGLRISQAKKMLRDTNIPIERVASEIGYETVTSFYRLFKKHIGVAPGEYRIATTIRQDSEDKN